MQLITATGQIHPLKLGVNSIGRGAGNDIVLQDGSMSRRHAELRWDGSHCVLTDLGSTNGTFLGSQRLAPHQPHPVPAGATLSFGPTMMVTLTADVGGIATAHVPFDSASPGRAASPDLLFRALDVALDLRKLALALLGFLGAGIVGAFFFWILAQVALESAVLSAAIGLVGAVLLWCILTLVTAALSRLIFLELSPGHDEGVRAALRYASQHFLSFLLSPLVLVVGVVLVLVVESVFLLLGRVDYAGELVVSLAFLPLVVLNLALILIVWLGTALVYPVVADRGGGIRDTISAVLTLVRRAPGRLVAYMMLAGTLSLLMFVIFFYLIVAAVSTTSALAGVGMETDKFAALASGLPLDLGLMPGLSFGSLSRYWLRETPATFAIARFLLGISLLAVAVIVLAIPQMFYLASTCAVYINLRQGVAAPGGKQTDGVSRGGGKGQAVAQKTCWLCGAPLAQDQTYCPFCKQLQR